ncbi:MAG: hypothetical protein P1U40_04745 [Coxiellaceae bacterium]|nr:hypothetical protein [Coxiellaceae bacterium]
MLADNRIISTGILFGELEASQIWLRHLKISLMFYPLLHFCVDPDNFEHHRTRTAYALSFCVFGAMHIFACCKKHDDIDQIKLSLGGVEIPDRQQDDVEKNIVLLWGSSVALWVAARMAFDQQHTYFDNLDKHDVWCGMLATLYFLGGVVTHLKAEFAREQHIAQANNPQPFIDKNSLR